MRGRDEMEVELCFSPLKLGLKGPVCEVNSGNREISKYGVEGLHADVSRLRMHSVDVSDSSGTRTTKQPQPCIYWHPARYSVAALNNPFSRRCWIDLQNVAVQNNNVGKSRKSSVLDK